MTSHGTCSKKQTIDLGFAGINEKVMDDKEPEIKVMEMYELAFFFIYLNYLFYTF